MENLVWFYLTKLCRLKLTNIEKIGKGPFILVSNHLSHFDWLLLHTLFRKELGLKTFFLAKEELFESPLLGWMVRHGESIPVNRDRPGKQSIKRSMQVLKQGHILALFPEGTRSPDGTLMAGLSGAAFFWRNAKVPVIPVGLHGLYEVLPKGRWLPKIHPCEVRVGAPIPFPESSEKPDLETLTDLIMGGIAKQLAPAAEGEALLAKGCTPAAE
ncbi:1-acyl-sn-glycerol-3-phosphate acyltransferase [Microbulbifer sp. Q7]|uniref:lysophospholipid acyltransferase family protein n=1 Tax=Microbulbifer sp. Q7 TaxID=1785091 RepID=UPI00082BA95B|nr:lysophospholipid acyltransferase family protein [Microbulbifer sp. Q7]